MPNFPIIDAHVHLFDPWAFDYWMRGDPALGQLHDSSRFSQQSVAVSVDRMVWVEVNLPADQSLAEAAWAKDASRRDPRIAAVVAGAPLELGEAARPMLSSLADIASVTAVRRLIQGHEAEPGWCLRPAFVEGVRLLAQFNLGFDLCVTHGQLGDVLGLVERCPDVRFMLDHLGKPAIAGQEIEPWHTQIRELAAHPNVACKISGAATEADASRPLYDQVAPYLEQAISAFGFERCAFASDWPICERAVGYADWVAIVDRVTAGSSSEQLQALYRKTAAAFYRL